MNKIQKHVEFTIGEWKYKSYRMKTHVANTKILKQTFLQVEQLHFFLGIWSSPTFNICCDIQVDNSCLRQTDFRIERALQ